MDMYIHMYKNSNVFKVGLELQIYYINYVNTTIDLYRFIIYYLASMYLLYLKQFF